MGTIIVGDAREELRKLPDESVHCVVTSPPYWGLRAYKGDPGMIGLEDTFEEHVENLVQVFREVWRVLRKDGTLWLNYGDAYASRGGAGNHPGQSALLDLTRRAVQGRCRAPAGFKPKDLMMMPARVAMTLRDDGWYLRSKIIWHKRNPMPESVTDRPTNAYEEMFLLTKSARYFYDAEAVKIPGSPNTHPRRKDNQKKPRKGADPGDRRATTWQDHRTVDEQALIGTNLRNVWTLSTYGYSKAHFATFPPKLVEPCIKAGTSEHGVCAECGAPYERVLSQPKGGTTGTSWHPHIDDMTHGQQGGTFAARGWENYTPAVTKGWAATCTCNAEIQPAVVLDPFAGAGTTGLVASRLQRDYILIEISPDYAEMARKRIHDDAPLLNADATHVLT